MRRIAAPALVTVLVAVAIWTAGCGSGDEAAVTRPHTPSGILETADLDGIHKGTLIVVLLISNLTKQEAFGITSTNRFKNLGGEGLPRLQLGATSNGRLDGRTVDFNGILAVRNGRAAVTYGPAYKERLYEFDSGTFDQLLGKFEAAQSEDGIGDLAACFRAAQGLRPARLVKNLTSEGRGRDRYGIPVTELSASIDVGGVIDSWIHLYEEPDCGAQLKAVGSPSVPQLEAAGESLRKRVKTAEVLLAVDQRGVLRSLTAIVEFRNSRDEEIAIRLECRLSEDSEVGILGAQNGESLYALLRRFGLDPQTALEAGGGESVIGFLEAFSRGLTGRL